MCCLFTVLVFLGPRAAIVVWWLIDPAVWARAFDTALWPILGLLILPWTTLMYVLVAPGGVDGFDWVWLALAVVADIAMDGGGAFGNRDRANAYR
jgi:hypothetical protein